MKGRRTKVLIICLICLVLAGGLLLLTADRSLLPLDPEQGAYIIFYIYPQDIPNFTLTDDQRVAEIITAINQLDMEPWNQWPKKMAEYNYSLDLHLLNGQSISLEISPDAISLNNEKYQANTRALHALLEQAYIDVCGGMTE